MLQDIGQGNAATGDVRDLARAARSPHRRSSRHRRQTRRLAIACVVSLLCLLVIVPTVAAMWFVRSLDTSMQVGGDVTAELTPVASSDDAFYALVLGSDNRGNEQYGRADSIMLVRVAPRAHQVDIISIPRDLQVRIGSSEQPQKINAAYAQGGTALMVTAVAQFAGVPIAHVAEIGFDGLTGLVDRLGGITVDVPQSFSGGNGGVSLQAGRQTLNGKQALGFVRERYQVQGGDFSRAQAQRIVLTALVSKLMEQPTGELPGLIRELAASLNTDLSVQELVKLGMHFRGSAPRLNTAGCPSYSFSQDGVSYVGVEYAEWQDMMRRVDAGMGPGGTGEIPAEQRDNTRLGSAENAMSPRDYAGLVDQSLNSDDVIGAQ